MPEPAGRDELHRPCRRGVVDLDLVVHARVGDVGALGITVVEDGETVAREPGGHGALGRSLLLDRGVRTWERVGNDREVRLVGADVDAVRQIAHVDLAAAGLRQLVGEAALRAEPEDRMLDLAARSASSARVVAVAPATCAGSLDESPLPRSRSQATRPAATAIAITAPSRNCGRRTTEGRFTRPPSHPPRTRSPGPGQGTGRTPRPGTGRPGRRRGCSSGIPRRRRRGRRRKA